MYISPNIILSSKHILSCSDEDTEDNSVNQVNKGWHELM